MLTVRKVGPVMGSIVAEQFIGFNAIKGNSFWDEIRQCPESFVYKDTGLCPDIVYVEFAEYLPILSV